MSRNVLFVLVLLAAGVVLADDAPEAGRGAGATGEQAKREAGEEPAAGPAGAQAKTEAGARPAADPGKAPARSQGDAKVISGMSILGNQEAPKSLVIVPWKGSELGDALGIPAMLDDSRQPVDRDVFMRALSYYEIRSGKTP